MICKNMILAYGRFPKFHRVFLGRDPGTLKSDIVSKEHPQLIRPDSRLSNRKLNSKIEIMEIGCTTTTTTTTTTTAAAAATTTTNTTTNTTNNDYKYCPYHTRNLRVTESERKFSNLYIYRSSYLSAIYLSIYIYIYIYTSLYISLSLSLYIYIYIYLSI